MGKVIGGRITNGEDNRYLWITWYNPDGKIEEKKYYIEPKEFDKRILPDLNIYNVIGLDEEELFDYIRALVINA